MRVPDDFLKCVGFVSEYLESVSPPTTSIDPEGTGFFVNIPSKVRPVNQYYTFVTAKHVAKSLQDRLTVITANQKGGGIAILEDTDDKWYLHPDDSVDVAVMAFTLTPNLDIKSIPVEMFLDRPTIGSVQIGIGDEVFFPGLFAYAASDHRNAPILRHGNIAMMAGEPIQVDSGFAEVHLIEARSIGGISGSPVLVRPTMALRNSAGQVLHGLGGEHRLFGLIHGHWDIKESEINQSKYAHDRQKGVNLGIAVVVPAHKILEVINDPRLVAMRDQADEELRRAPRAPEE